MAHFAELDSDNKVKRVVVVGNDVETAAGPLGENDMHVDGETWCVNFFKGGTWKQTSYNHNFRKQYAGIGYVYDSTKDKFSKGVSLLFKVCFVDSIKFSFLTVPTTW